MAFGSQALSGDVLIYLLWLPAWTLIFRELPDWGSVEFQYLAALVFVGAVVIAALYNTVLSLVLAPLFSRMGHALAAKRTGYTLLALLTGIAVLSGIAVPAFLGAAILSVLIAHQAIQERRYEADWA